MPDKNNFISLINEHKNIIRKVCFLYVKADMEREDMFQEIVLQAWKSFPSFKGNAKFSTWLYKVALNTTITFVRKTKRSVVVTTDTLPDTTGLDNVTEEQTKAMYRAIEDLSKIEKALIMLYLDDYSYNDIGDILGIKANNVAVKILRIKEKLRVRTQYHYQ